MKSYNSSLTNPGLPRMTHLTMSKSIWRRIAWYICSKNRFIPYGGDEPRALSAFDMESTSMEHRSHESVKFSYLFVIGDRSPTLPWYRTVDVLANDSHTRGHQTHIGESFLTDHCSNVRLLCYVACLLYPFQCNDIPFLFD